jgi:hypothetical protein
MSVLAPEAAAPLTSDTVSVGDAISPRLERAVRAFPDGWTIGVELKKPSFWVVAVPILVPVVVSVTMFLAEMSRLPPLTVNPPVAVATVMSAEPLKDTPPIV